MKETVKNEIVTITDVELLKAIEDRQAYKNMIDEAERIVKELDAKIKKAIEDSGSNTIICGEHKAILSKYTQERVSAKDVKGILSAELFEQIVSRSISTRLTVK